VNIGEADISRIVKAVMQSMDRSAAGTVAGCAAPAHALAGVPTRPLAALPMGVFTLLDDAVAEADRAYRQMRSVAMRSRVVAAIRQAGENTRRNWPNWRWPRPAWAAWPTSLSRMFRKPCTHREWSAWCRPCCQATMA